METLLTLLRFLAPIAVVVSVLRWRKQRRAADAAAVAVALSVVLMLFTQLPGTKLVAIVAIAVLFILRFREQPRQSEVTENEKPRRRSLEPAKAGKKKRRRRSLEPVEPVGVEPEQQSVPPTEPAAAPLPHDSTKSPELGPEGQSEIAGVSSYRQARLRERVLSRSIESGQTEQLVQALAGIAMESDKKVVLEAARAFIRQGHGDFLIEHFRSLPVFARKEIAAYLPGRDVENRRADLARLYEMALEDEDRVVAGKARQTVELEDIQPLKAKLQVHAEARKGWFPLEVQVQGGTLNCENGLLRIEAGAFKAELSVEHQAREGHDDELRVALRFSDSEGRRWQTKTFVVPSAFSDTIDDDSQRENVEMNGGFVPWIEAPPEWRSAIDETCLIGGMHQVMDSRNGFEIRIGSRTHEIMMKYQDAKFDIAPLDHRLVVRASGLQEAIEDGESWERLPMPPFAWLVSPDRFLCFAHPEYHCATVQEVREFYEEEERTPSLAAPLETRGEPQPSVVFHPA